MKADQKRNSFLLVTLSFPLDSPLASAATKLVAVDTAVAAAVDVVAFVVAEAPVVVAAAAAEAAAVAVACCPTLCCPRWHGRPPILQWQLAETASPL